MPNPYKRGCAHPRYPGWVYWGATRYTGRYLPAGASTHEAIHLHAWIRETNLATRIASADATVRKRLLRKTANSPLNLSVGERVALLEADVAALKQKVGI